MTLSAEADRCDVDDDREALDSLIDQAQQITGIDGPDAEEDGDEPCRLCGATYPDDGEGYDGFCPRCADKISFYLDEGRCLDWEAAVDALSEPHECQKCERWWAEADLDQVRHLSMRVSPGEPMPSGQCPECGAVCHPVKFGSKEGI